MITTKELCEWQKHVENTKQQALQQAKAYIHNEGMRLYYVNLTQVADAQLALVQRMIRQSEANEGGKKMMLCFEYGGLSFRVQAEVNEGYVEEVSRVEVICNTGYYAPLKVDKSAFLTAFEDKLNEAVEDAIETDRQVNADMLYETAREEGRI